MADIFREVDEEVRADRARELWRRYGVYAVAAATAVVIAVAGMQLWRHLQEEARIEAGDRLVAADRLLDEERTDEAAAVFGSLAEDGGGAGLLAHLRSAALLAQGGEHDAAIAAYGTIAADDGIAPVYRDLARLYQGMNQLDAGRPEEAVGLLGPLAQSGPFRHSARETVAAARIALSEVDAAKADLKALAGDSEAPAGLRARARETLAALGEPQ